MVRTDIQPDVVLTPTGLQAVTTGGPQ